MLLAEPLNIELQQVSITFQHVVERSNCTCKSDNNHSETCHCDRPLDGGGFPGITFSYYKVLKILRRKGMLARTKGYMLELQTRSCNEL
jgi:hypothetical protein